MSTDIRRTASEETYVRVLTNYMTAWDVREFVRALDEAGIDDREQITASRSHDGGHFNGLWVRVVKERPIVGPHEPPDVLTEVHVLPAPDGETDDERAAWIADDAAQVRREDR